MRSLASRPVIGITGAYVLHNKFTEGTYVHHDYQKAIHANGGLPVILPFVSEELAEETVNLCDAILLSGGEDVDPAFYNQDPHQKLGSTIPLRDKVELALIKAAMEKRKPILAICRGVQILNVALGGTLLQDIPSQVSNSIQHTQTAERGRDTHWATIDVNSRLYEIIGVESVRVNSLHHQAIDRLADALKVTASSSDGIIEAVEQKNYADFLLGIQWHPESMASSYERMNRIFAQFIAAAK